MTIVSAVKGYFGLVRPQTALGAKERKLSPEIRAGLWNGVFYMGVAVGVLGEILLDGTSRFSLPILLRGFLMAGVILPVVFKTARLDRVKPRFIHAFVCLQHGYFWESIIAKLASGGL